jgi:hypothetical protein
MLITPGFFTIDVLIQFSKGDKENANQFKNMKSIGGL